MFQWEDVQMRSCLKWEIVMRRHSNEKLFKWKVVPMFKWKVVQMRSCQMEVVQMRSCSNENLFKWEVVQNEKLFKNEKSFP